MHAYFGWRGDVQLDCQTFPFATSQEMNGMGRAQEAGSSSERVPLWRFLLYKGNFLLFFTIGSSLASFHILVSLPNKFHFIRSLLWKKLNLIDTTMQTRSVYLPYGFISFNYQEAKGFPLQGPQDDCIHSLCVFQNLPICFFCISYKHKKKFKA